MDDSTQHQAVFDADQQQLGDVYAKALLGFGQQTGRPDALVDELEEVVGVISRVPRFRDVLESPRIPFSEKSQLLDKAFAGKVDDSVLKFLKVVGSKNRFDCLPAITASARKMQDEQAGRVQAVLTSATEVDDATRDRIAERLSQVLGRSVRLKSGVDPTIVGGVVVRVGDTVYDGSIVNQLEQVRSKAIQRANDAIRERLDRFVVAE